MLLNDSGWLDDAWSKRAVIGKTTCIQSERAGPDESVGETIGGKAGQRKMVAVEVQVGPRSTRNQPSFHSGNATRLAYVHRRPFPDVGKK